MELRPRHGKHPSSKLPTEWKAEPLGDVGNWLSGGTPPISNEAYWDGEIPWVSPKDMKVARLHDSIDHVSERALGNGTRLAPRGAILMVVRGMILAHSFPVARAERPLAFNQDIKALVVRLDVDSEFILRWLQANEKRLLSDTNEATHGTKRMPSEALFAASVALPPLPEQHTIALALGDMDALISSLHDIINKKRAIKHATAQQLLTGRLRLTGFSDKWETKKVSKMGDVLAGKALDVTGPGRLRPYLRTKNVLDGRIVLDDVLEMPFVDAAFEQFRIKDGDILLNEGQSLHLVGRCSMYREELVSPCAMQNQLLRFRARADTSSAFAEHLFRHCQHTGIFSAIATQTTSVAHLGSARFKNLPLVWPSVLAEQRAIAAVLSDMDAELAALERRREKTLTLKQSMMQELLTGRTRLV